MFIKLYFFNTLQPNNNDNSRREDANALFTSPQEPSTERRKERPKRHGSLALFFRKVYFQ